MLELRLRDLLLCALGASMCAAFTPGAAMTGRVMPRASGVSMSAREAGKDGVASRGAGAVALQRRSVLGLLGAGTLALPLRSMAEEQGGKGSPPKKPEEESTASAGGGGGMAECDTPKPKPDSPEVCEADY